MDAKSDIAGSDIFDSLISSLNEGIRSLKTHAVHEIICFGIGKIGECFIARYQFALLLCLKDFYKVNVQIYDPVLTPVDLSLLNEFEISLLIENLEGKYKVCGRNVLFYLPHCPKQLSNNLLWANWGLNLSHCIIIANSFNTIIEQSTSSVLKNSAEYVSKICPYTLELPVINSFKYFEIFNDTAVHFFPKINMIPQDLWDQCAEPMYLEDVEFITNSKS